MRGVIVSPQPTGVLNEMLSVFYSQVTKDVAYADEQVYRCGLRAGTQNPEQTL